MACDGLFEEAEAVDDFLSGDEEVIDVCLLVKNDAAVKVEGVWFCGGQDTLFALSFVSLCVRERERERPEKEEKNTNEKNIWVFEVTYQGHQGRKIRTCLHSKPASV